MNLAEHGRAHSMRLQPCPVSFTDPHLAAHAHPVARGPCRGKSGMRGHSTVIPPPGRAVINTCADAQSRGGGASVARTGKYLTLLA
jgi:hypothetical protein